MVETFFDLDELATAIDAVRSVSNLPIVALMTFGEDAQTIGGVGAAEAAERLVGLEIAAIGTNHGAGRTRRSPRSRRWATASPLAALPNIGLASMFGGRVIYPHAAPEYFAEFAAHARDLGASVIGGCCGTTPTEIAAIRRAVDEGRRRRAARGGRTRARGGGRARRRRDTARTICARVGSSRPFSSTRRSERTTPG